MEIVPVNHGFHVTKRSDRYERWMATRSDAYHTYRAKWIDNPKNYIDDGYPLNIDIETSAACNLRCPMCIRTSLESQKGGKLRESLIFPFDLYKRIVDEAAELGVPAIKLNWLGEPLINPHIADMVQYAKEKGIEEVLINTNAVLLTEDLSEKLIRAGLDGLFFSFDSHDKQIYESIRIGAKYDDVLNNIIRFHEIRESLGSVNPLTRMSMVAMPQNRDAKDAYAAAFGHVADTIVYYDLADYNEDFSFLRDRTDIVFSCSQLWQRMVISATGDISVCCNDWESDCSIGNIKNTTIKEAWNSPRYREIRDYHRNKEWYKVSICQECRVVIGGQSGSV